jgi:hypothetical protein
VNGGVLGVVLEGQEAAALAGLPVLLATARAQGARLRLVGLRTLPAPRRDRHDRVVADTDQEMARIAREFALTFDAVSRREADVLLEPVVRFGAPARELRVEAELFAPDRVAFFDSPASPLATRLRSWLLRHRRPGWATLPLVVIQSPRRSRRAALRSSVHVLPPTPAR